MSRPGSPSDSRPPGRVPHRLGGPPRSRRAGPPRRPLRAGQAHRSAESPPPGRRHPGIHRRLAGHRAGPSPLPPPGALPPSRSPCSTLRGSRGRAGTREAFAARSGAGECMGSPRGPRLRPGRPAPSRAPSHTGDVDGLDRARLRPGRRRPGHQARSSPHGHRSGPLVSPRPCRGDRAGRHARRHVRGRAHRPRADGGRRRVRARGPVRPPAGAAPRGGGEGQLRAVLLPRLDLRPDRPLCRHSVPRPEGHPGLAARRARLSLPRGVRPGVRVSRGPRGARVRPVPRRAHPREPALPDALPRPPGELPLLVHAREPAGHEPPVPAPPLHGAHPDGLPRYPPRRRLGGGRLHRSGAPAAGSPSASGSCWGGAPCAPT